MKKKTKTLKKTKYILTEFEAEIFYALISGIPERHIVEAIADHFGYGSMNDNELSEKSVKASDKVDELYDKMEGDFDCVSEGKGPYI